MATSWSIGSLKPGAADPGGYASPPTPREGGTVGRRKRRVGCDQEIRKHDFERGAMSDRLQAVRAQGGEAGHPGLRQRRMGGGCRCIRWAAAGETQLREGQTWVLISADSASKELTEVEPHDHYGCYYHVGQSKEAPSNERCITYCFGYWKNRLR